jgi:hypothetical protein
MQAEVLAAKIVSASSVLIIQLYEECLTTLFTCDAFT